MPMILGFKPEPRDFYVQRLKDYGDMGLDVNLSFHTAPTSLSSALQIAVRVSALLDFVLFIPS